jgi:hypothetical protein
VAAAPAAARKTIRAKWGDKVFVDYERYLDTCVMAFDGALQLARAVRAPPHRLAMTQRDLHHEPSDLLEMFKTVAARVDKREFPT